MTLRGTRMPMDSQTPTQILLQNNSDMYESSKDRIIRVMSIKPNFQTWDILTKDNEYYNKILEMMDESFSHNGYASSYLSKDLGIKDILSLTMWWYDDVITKIRKNNMESIAKRLEYLCSLKTDSQKEEATDRESLNLFANFVMDNSKLSNPQITISPDGFVNAEWFIQDYCDLSIEFLPSGTIKFSVLFQPLDLSPKFINGVQDMAEGMQTLKPFMSKLIHT